MLNLHCEAANLRLLATFELRELERMKAILALINTRIVWALFPLNRHPFLRFWHQPATRQILTFAFPTRIKDQKKKWIYAVYRFPC